MTADAFEAWLEGEIEALDARDADYARFIATRPWWEDMQQATAQIAPVRSRRAALRDALAKYRELRR